MKSKDGHSGVRSDEAEIIRMWTELRTRFIWATNATTDEMDKLLDAFILRCKKDYSIMADTIICFGRDKN